MNKIIILYPPEFKCYEKFSRKILKIINNIENISIFSNNDTNGYIKRLINEHPKSILFFEGESWKDEKITHAIIFTDEEEFIEETKYIKSINIPLRTIKIPITRVINIKNNQKYQNIKSDKNYEYIGRGSYWGNPYSMYEEGESRDEVIRKFAYDFEFDKFPNKKKSEVEKLAGKILGCFCKPLACHGDILADYLNSLDDGK